jgi:tetratricopeptide (TPR) repeat protein
LLAPRIHAVQHLLQRSDVAAARNAAVSLQNEHGDHPDVLRLLADVALAADDLEAARTFIDSATERAPGRADLHLQRARILRLARRRQDARHSAHHASRCAPDTPPAQSAIGRMLVQCDDPAGATPFFERALASASCDPFVRYELAAAQFFSGDFESAEHHLETLLERQPQLGAALYLRSTLRRQTHDRNHVADLQQRLRSGFADAASQAACFYALAKELEDLGDADASFAALTRGATIKRGTLRHDAAGERAAIASIRSTYTADVMARPTTGWEDRGPIFIVGMPRTGTTLLERMLGRHPRVRSAGELPDFGEALAQAVRALLRVQPGRSMVETSIDLDFAALGRDYLEGARQAAGDAEFVIDKMPINFMYCGLIHKALPNARILHLVRDPMDACYAVYKTLFNRAYLFSYDLEELAAYFATYRNLMQHWHAVMPGAILDVHYQDLVRHPEIEMRRVLAWCGLEWSGDVLAPERNERPALSASAAQVREPIHTGSIGRWKQHERGLQPLREALERAGVSTHPR